MTSQEIFDKVATHLLTQGEASMSDAADLCLYRSPSGLKCAAGALIADAHYCESLERRNADDPLVIEAITKSIGPLDADQIRLIHQLQHIHDTHQAGDWWYALQGFARCNNLNFNPPIAKEAPLTA